MLAARQGSERRERRGRAGGGGGDAGGDAGDAATPAAVTQPVDPNFSQRPTVPSPREDGLATPSTQEMPPSGISVTLTSARSKSPSGETSSSGGVASHSAAAAAAAAEERRWQSVGSVAGGGWSGRGGGRHRSSSSTVSNVRGGSGGGAVGGAFECGCVRSARTRSQSASSSASSGASSMQPNFGADLQRSTGGLNPIQFHSQLKFNSFNRNSFFNSFINN